ncbi:MAG TPA: nitroreductase family protein [Candidatus Limnocylindria bacterium]|nr:nitroreductase family protein [Candidatus Limnocylindria bacterium]
MDFAEVVRKRRMVRNYDASQPVAREVLERIAAAAQRAPSAGFSQGQRLVVVTDPDVRRRIAELANEDAFVAAGFDPWVSRAPALIVPCISEAIYHRRYQEPDKLQEDGTEIDWPIPYWYMDIGATALLVHQAAISEGLAAGYLGLGDYSDLKALLGIPADMQPVGIITIGYPLPDRRSGSLKRGWVAKDEFAHWEKW